MSDLDRIEAVVGPLPKGRAVLSIIGSDPPMGFRKDAKGALDEAYAVIERQAKMLRLAARISWTEGEGSDAPMPDEFVEFYLADLARRAKEANDE